MTKGGGEGRAATPSDRLVTCQYYLDPQEPDLPDPELDISERYQAALREAPIDGIQRGAHLDFEDEAAELLEPFEERTGHDRDVWRCRRLAEPDDDGPTTCPFHTDPAERRIRDEDLAQIFLALVRDRRTDSDFLQAYIDEHLADEYENADEFLRVVPRNPPLGGDQSAVANQSVAVARRRKMFCGAQFGTFDLSDVAFESPDRYPIDLQGATVQKLDWSGAIVESPIRAAGLCQVGPAAGEIRLSGAELAGPVQLDGVVSRGKVSVSEAQVDGTVSLRHAVVRGGVSLREASIQGDIMLARTLVCGQVLLVGVTTAKKLSLSHAIAAKVMLSSGRVGTRVVLHEATIIEEVSITQSTVGDRVTLFNATVHGPLSLNGTAVDGEIDLDGALIDRHVTFIASTASDVSFEDVTIHGRLVLVDADVDHVSLGSNASVGRSLVCTGLTAATITITNPCVNGALDFTGVTAESLRISPPVKAKRHPAVRAVCLRASSIERIQPEVMPGGDPDDTIVYDFEAASIGAIERPTAVPEEWTVYDFFRFVETDFAGFDFSFHRDGFHQNGWNLHGLVPGGERAVQIAQKFETPPGETTSIVAAVETSIEQHEFPPALDPVAGPDRREQDASATVAETADEPESGRDRRDPESVQSDAAGTLPAVDERGHPRDHAPQPARQRMKREAAAAERWVDAWLADEDCPGLSAEMRRAWDETLPEYMQRRRLASRDGGESTEQAIAASRVLSAADRLCSIGPLSPSIDDGPPTVDLNQLEATYTRAKTAADEVGENEAASAFFRREQRYIQLQTRRQIRDEAVRWWSGSRPTNLYRYGIKWVENASLRLFTQYGESPGRVLSWWVGIICLWSVLYYTVALFEVGATAPSDMWALLSSHGFGFVLLSIGSFATLIPAGTVLPGEASLAQTESIVQSPVITLLSEVEALVGVLFLSLFVLTLTRSIHR